MFHLLKDEPSIIKVIGVGGGGGNAVNYMFQQGIMGVEFAICNTDAQVLQNSPIPNRISLGPNITEGRGAGSKPTVGRQSAIESIEDIRNYLDGTKMLFITAGMGGGTGTGAAPIVAKTAKEMGILTVGIITLPFSFEGKRRIEQAYEGLEDLRKHCDSLVVISNDKLKDMFSNLTITNAFAQADQVLCIAAKGIAEIITRPGVVNLDFEDVSTVMRDSGMAVMGNGIAEGENRARRAADEALNSPLLEENNIQGARWLLVNISSGNKETTMEEMFTITNFIQEEAGGADLIFGHCKDETLGDSLSVTVIATGFDHQFQNPYANEQAGLTHRGVQPTVVNLEDNPTDNQQVTFDMPAKNNRPLYSNQRAQNQPQPAQVMEPRRLNSNQYQQQQAATFRQPVTDLTTSDMESTPAYIRRGYQFDQPGAANSEISNLYLNGRGEINVENTSLYLDRDAD
jgi:cell division protein FtsZ